MKLQDEDRLGKWTETNLRWLHETCGRENVVFCVLHMDEKTSHLHAIIVPIVVSERQRREREGERTYKTKSGSRLSADDVLKRVRLREYQGTYAVAMKPFGLERGIVGSTAKRVATSTRYKQQMRQFEEDIAKLRNGYQKEFDAAIKRAEESEKVSRDKDNVISRQKQRITELDKQVNTHRYRLFSGAELVGHHFFGNNPYTIILKIWTKVKDVEHTAFTYLMYSNPILKAFSNEELTEREFINTFFTPSELVNMFKPACLVLSLN